MNSVTFECYVITNIDETKFYDRNKSWNGIDNASLYAEESNAINVVRGLNARYSYREQPFSKYIKVRITAEEV